MRLVNSRYNISDLMAARAPEGKESAIFRDEAGLRFGIGLTARLYFFFYPLNLSLWVQKLDEALCSIAYNGNLEAVFAVAYFACVRHFEPGSNKHTGRCEIVVIVEIVLNTFFGFGDNMWLVGLPVVHGAFLGGVNICVESCY